MTNIDIYYRGNGVARILSNLYNHPFKFRGRDIKSIDSFIQGIKHQDLRTQNYVFGLDGLQAKHQASKVKDSTVYFDMPINRHSEAYSDLLLEVYITMAKQNKAFRDALRQTKGFKLTHSIGSKNKNETLLIEDEFIAILELIREYL